jgi:hypothetical protein
MHIVSESRTGRRCPSVGAGMAVVARQRPGWAPWLAILMALGMAGCTSASLGDLPPQLGGMAAGTPERPATPSAYPAVHDMPPPRQDVVLTPEEQKKAQADLTALRTQQEKQGAALAAGTAAKTQGAAPKDQ